MEVIDIYTQPFEYEDEEELISMDLLSGLN